MIGLNATNAKMQGAGAGTVVGGGLGGMIAGVILTFTPTLVGTIWEDVIQYAAMIIVAVAGAMFGSFAVRNKMTIEQVKVATAQDHTLEKQIAKEAVVTPEAVKAVIDKHTKDQEKLNA